MGRRGGGGAARRVLAALALLLALPCAAETVAVFAAASLKGSLDEVARAFEAESPHRVRVAYGASPAMARQVEAGAPAQLFLSADPEWVDYLAARGRVAARRDLLANELVLVAPVASKLALRIEPGFALAAALGGGRLAIGDPARVPAGKYARAALTRLGAWASVESRTAPAENVRSALALVARGEAPLGIVYRTDALAEKGVRVVDAFPAGSHPPIVYPLAELRGAGEGARSFARFCASPSARAIWSRHGFGLA